MKKQGLLCDFEGGLLSNVEPLVEEIRQFLADNHSVILSDFECYMLGKLINLDSFRNLVEFSYFYKKGFFNGEVDASHLIMEVLGDQAMHTFVFSQKSDFPIIKRKSDFDDLWNKYTLPPIELSIKKSLQDKTLDLLNILENDKKGHDIDELTQTLKLTMENMKEIVDALAKVGYIENVGHIVKVSENPPQEICFESEELKKKMEEFMAEEKYFQRTGRFKSGGIYENMYKQGQLAIDGKKIKQWAFPIPSRLFIRELMEKLCKLSSTYCLFQKLEDGKVSRLYDAWRSKKVRFSTPP